MAGIGFVLKKLIKKDRYSSDFKANLYAVVVSSGPWLFAVLCIAGLSIFSSPLITENDLILFRAIIIYVYAFSLITTSIFQLVLTRFISDRLYQREYSSLLPSFLGSIVIVGIMNLLVSSTFIYFAEIDFVQKVLAVILFCSVGYQWIILNFLSSVRDYMRIVRIFFVGFLLSFLAALLLGQYYNLVGYLAGYTLGQLFIVMFMVDRLIKEFPFGKDKIFEFGRYFKNYHQLALTAFLYNLGFWIDKFLVWFSPRGRVTGGIFHYHYPYDTALFLGLLTIIPAMAIFFLQVETDFYEGLRNYINTILKKGTLEEIDHTKDYLINELKDKLNDVTQTQLLFTVIMFLLAPRILVWLRYSPDDLQLRNIFMISIFAAFFQVMFLIMVVLLWYIELLNESLFCVGLFAGLNFTVNLILLNYYPEVTIGVGYLASVVVSCGVTAFVLISNLKQMNYLIFLRKPLVESQPIMPEYE
ncbi:MAG: exopolysaccharide Pel transporter PelG [Vulcanimicrobiota bacterium]